VLAATRFNLWPTRVHPEFRHYPWASHTVIYQYRPWVVREIVWFVLDDSSIARRPMGFPGGGALKRQRWGETTCSGRPREAPAPLLRPDPVGCPGAR